MSSSESVRVGICMGSDSDLPVMREVAEVLSEFGISHELRVISAHRTPEAMFDYARSARDRGIEVIVAGAGGAAHLPGMIASIISLPVIGVPIPSKQLKGIDSLLSIVQMPPGVPVATMAIGGGRNAGLFTVRILSRGDRALTEKLEASIAATRERIRAADEAVRRGSSE